MLKRLRTENEKVGAISCPVVFCICIIGSCAFLHGDCLGSNVFTVGGGAGRRDGARGGRRTSEGTDTSPCVRVPAGDDLLHNTGRLEELQDELHNTGEELKQLQPWLSRHTRQSDAEQHSDAVANCHGLHPRAPPVLLELRQPGVYVL